MTIGVNHQPLSTQDSGLSTWHLYCHIVDNFGDVGVLWRLARQLVNEYGQRVHLWVDQWDVARALIPGLPLAPALASVDGVWVGPWSALADGSDCTGDVLVEGFGCELPAIAQAQLKTRAGANAPKPLFINLEYFTAEKWVEGYHLRSGFDPPTGARRWFFFPSFPGRCGGLIREKAPLPPGGGGGGRSDLLKILCFAYATAPYAAWLDGLREAIAQPIHLLLCGGYTQRAFTPLPPGGVGGGNVLEHAPFLSQPDFDDLLRGADMLWVRGEDSMARALWSGRPFIWQLYPQDENAHHAKLEAWLENYAAPFSRELRAALADVHRAWNGAADGASIGPALQKLMALWPEWQTAARARSEELAKLPSLAQNLMDFVVERETGLTAPSGQTCQ